MPRINVDERVNLPFGFDLYPCETENDGNDKPMPVLDGEIVQSSEQIVTPSTVWLYPRFKYTEDGIRERPFVFRSLCNGLTKMVDRFSGWEADALIGSAGISHKDAYCKIKGVPEVMNGIPNDGRESNVRERLFLPSYEGEVTGLNVTISNSFVKVLLGERFSKLAKLTDMSFGPR